MSGQIKKTMFSCPEKLLEKTEEEFISGVRAESGYKLTRSSLIQSLLELAIEAKPRLDAGSVFDQGSFKEELRKALRKNNKS